MFLHNTTYRTTARTLTPRPGPTLTRTSTASRPQVTASVYASRVEDTAAQTEIDPHNPSLNPQTKQKTRLVTGHDSLDNLVRPLLFACFACLDLRWLQAEITIRSWASLFRLKRPIHKDTNNILILIITRVRLRDSGLDQAFRT